MCLVCTAQNKARPLIDCTVFLGTQERDVPWRWPLRLPMGRAWGPGEDLRRARARPAAARGPLARSLQCVHLQCCAVPR